MAANVRERVQSILEEATPLEERLELPRLCGIWRH